MSNLDIQIRAAIENLKGVISQLQSGDLSLLYAKRHDQEWTNGANPMIAHYRQIVALLELILEDSQKRAELKKSRRAQKAATKDQP